MLDRGYWRPCAEKIPNIVLLALKSRFRLAPDTYESRVHFCVSMICAVRALKWSNIVHYFRGKKTILAKSHVPRKWGRIPFAFNTHTAPALRVSTRIALAVIQTLVAGSGTPSLSCSR